MRYLMVDRITQWQSSVRMTGVKNVAMGEDFLEFHFKGNPVMPGVLLVEGFVQLAGWLEAASSDFTNWFLLNQVRKCNYYGFALPGDQVQLDLEAIPAVTAGLKSYRGTGTVEGKKKIVVDFDGVTIPLAEIEDAAAQQHFFKVLTREFKL